MRFGKTTPFGNRLTFTDANSTHRFVDPRMAARLGCLGLLLLAVGGCATAEPVYRGIYEGLQIREELVNPSTTYRPMERRLGYWQYDAERKRLLNEGPAK